MKVWHDKLTGQPPPDTPMRDPMLQFRDEFPILARTTYLVSHSLGAMPRGVAERLADYVDVWAEQGVRAWSSGWWEMPVAVGDEIAPLLGASPQCVVMVPTVTLAHAVVVSALDFAGGRDTIVMTALDFPSVRYVCEQLAPRFGARVVVVPSDDGITIDPARLLEAIDERTRLVAVSHVMFRSAFIQDADAICRRAHDVGALVMLDAFHSVGVIPVNVAASGVDFLAGGVLKWLCGGPGGCFLYVAPHVRESLVPALTGWQAHRSPFAFSTPMEYAPDVVRWLGGTPVIPALYAALEGPRLLRRAGIANVREKSTRQTSRLIEMADDRGYRVHAPRDPAQRGGTVAIGVPHADEVAQYLLSRDVLVDYRPGAGIRIAPHFYTRDDELEMAIETIDDTISTERWRAYTPRESTVT